MQAKDTQSTRHSRESFSKTLATVWIHPGYANLLLLEYKGLFR